MYIGQAWSYEDIQISNQFSFLIAEEIINDILDFLTVRKAQSRFD
jgi:hypothetical protein